MPKIESDIQLLRWMYQVSKLDTLILVHHCNVKSLALFHTCLVRTRLKFSFGIWFLVRFVLFSNIFFCLYFPCFPPIFVWILFRIQNLFNYTVGIRLIGVYATLDNHFEELEYRHVDAHNVHKVLQVKLYESFYLIGMVWVSAFVCAIYIYTWKSHN